MGKKKKIIIISVLKALFYLIFISPFVMGTGFWMIGNLGIALCYIVFIFNIIAVVNILKLKDWGRKLSIGIDSLFILSNLITTPSFVTSLVKYWSGFWSELPFIILTIIVLYLIPLSFIYSAVQDRVYTLVCIGV